MKQDKISGFGGKLDTMLMNSNTSTKNTWKQTALGVILLVVLIVLGGYIFVLFGNFISHSNPEIAAAIIAGIVTTLVSVFSLIWSKRTDRQKQIEEAHRAQKVKTYEDFLEFIFRVLVSSKSGKQLTQQEMVEFFSKFNQRMIVWASDSVLKEFSKFRNLSTSYAEAQQNNNTSNSDSISVLDTMISLENLLYAIRLDVGHNNKNLVKGDLLSLFITDIDEYLKLLPK